MTVDEKIAAYKEHMDRRVGEALAAAHAPSITITRTPAQEAALAADAFRWALRGTGGGDAP